MLAGTAPSFLYIYRDRWYPIAVQHPSAFRQMLASYALHLFRLQGGVNHKLEQISLSHHTKVLVSLRQQLSLTGQILAEGDLFAILLLACYAHINADVKTWNIHMSAVRNMVRSSLGTPVQASLTFINLFQWWV